MPLFLAFLAQFGPPPIWASQCRIFPTLPILRTRSPDPPSTRRCGEKIYDRGPCNLPCRGNVNILIYYKLYVVYFFFVATLTARSLDKSPASGSICLTKRIVSMYIDSLSNKIAPTGCRAVEKS